MLQSYAVAQMSQHKLDEALKQLVAAELIFRRGTPPDAEYTFKHALVQDAAYSTLLRSRRQQLHARIATTLESGTDVLALAGEEPDSIRDALGDLLDGFVLTVLIAGAISTIYYGIRLVKELRRSTRR
jgi:hypothetical protein